MISVFLLDDHEVVRTGIAAIVDGQPDMQVVGEAATARAARGRIALLEPDVAVLDVQLPDGSGTDVCRDIRSRHPQVHCLILTAFDDDEAVYAAVLAGAAGYVLKDVRGLGLIGAIRQVAAGAQLLDARAVEHTARALRQASIDGPVPLTLRERQVLGLIAEGRTNREIGERLGLAEKTVKNYVSSLLSKLGMQRRTQAAVYGASLGHR